LTCGGSGAASKKGVFGAAQEIFTSSTSTRYMSTSTTTTAATTAAQLRVEGLSSEYKEYESYRSRDLEAVQHHFPPCIDSNPLCSAGVRDGGATTVHADAQRRHLSSQPATREGGTSKNLPPSSSSGSSLGRAGRAGLAPRTSFPGRRRRLEGQTKRLEIGCRDASSRPGLRIG